LVDDSLGFSRMWLLAVPVSHRNDIWGYWSEEGDKLFVTGPCNDFYFDLFRKMLFHTGFQNGDEPFYIGYVTAEVRGFMKSMRSNKLHICFHPSWRWVRDKGPICYIGKKDDTYYTISPRDFDPKRYLVRNGTYEREPFCTIDETEWPKADSDAESSVESSVLDKVKWAKRKDKNDDHGEDIDEDIDDGENSDNSTKDDVQQVVDGVDIDEDIDDGEDNDNSKKDDVEHVVEEKDMTEGDQDGEAIEKEVLAADAMSGADDKDIEEEAGQHEQVLYEPMDAETRESMGKADGNNLSSLSKTGNDEGHDENDKIEKGKTNVDLVSEQDCVAVRNHDTNSHPNDNEEIETFAPSSPDKTAKGEESIDTEDYDRSGVVMDNESHDDNEKLSDGGKMIRKIQIAMIRQARK